jgi:hypothetical protein
VGFAPRTRYDAPVREPSTPDSSRTLSSVFLAQIVIATILGVVLSLALDPILAEDARTLIFLLFICIAISEVIMARFVVQKQLREGAEGSRQQAIVLANAFAGAIAVYGLVIGVLSGNWYYVIPFGVIALAAWQYLHHLIRTTPETPAPSRRRNR